MGQYDSSRTRVAPIFNQLLAKDPSGASWLEATLALGSRRALPAFPVPPLLVPNHGRRWGNDEYALPAPLSLLEYLVQNVDPRLAKRSKGRGKVRAKRLALARKDAATISSALAYLRSGRVGRHWSVLEGPSRPDALFETCDFVICVEGKRTEGGCTTYTSWMPRRSQLVRHMDAATDAFKGKSVFGLLIVEGSSAEARVPSQRWYSECAKQYEPVMLADSLPHRSLEQRSEIGKNILGVTTWQAVCAATGIDWATLPDTI